MSDDKKKKTQRIDESKREFENERGEPSGKRDPVMNVRDSLPPPKPRPQK